MALGILSLAQDALRNTLADSTVYRALTAPAMDQAAALASIYREGLPPPADTHEYTLAEYETYRPYAVIENDKDGGLAGSKVTLMNGGRMLVTIERNAPDGAEDTPSDPATQEWMDIAGQILDELLTLSGTTENYLNITGVDEELSPAWAVREDARTQGIFQTVTLGVEWEGAGP